MTTNDNRYFLVTPPMEFISDVYDIMKDGDGLTSDKLVTDVVGMLKNYLAAQPSPVTEEEK